ncbi:MAG TPA: DNA-binding protein [Candidatus Nitrosotenuis sp.]|nr:DNA-binding protein [Candidatus Nitrosotenuis sp.]
MSKDTPTEAEEIFTESQKLKDDADTVDEAKPESDEDSKKTRDVIFVGTKPIMTYVTATLTQLSTQSFVTIKARGQRITQAVDVSQMIVKRMNTVGYKIKDVRIASDSLLSQDGKTRNVSTIEIDITKE